MNVQRLLLRALVGLGCFSGLAAWAQAFHFVALGDLPYGPAEKAGPPYRALIASINRDKPAFSIHVGDIKSGSTECSDAEFERQRIHFGLFAAPVVYTPGDNEWTDCHRASNGRYDPVERLQALRRVFFAPGRSFGQVSMGVENQSTRMPEHGAFIENQRWMHGGVMFMTVHVVGSNNNLDRRRPQTLPEFRDRERANIAWLRESFGLLRGSQARAVVVAMQANPLGVFNFSGAVPEDSGFHATIGQTLLPLAREASVPVLLVHGDTHSFRFDNPFWLNGEPVSNVTRLEVPGEGDVRAVRVEVDLNRSPVFSVKLLAAD